MMQQTSVYHRFVISLILLYNSVLGLDPSIDSFTSKVHHNSDSSIVFMDCDVTNLPTTASIQLSKITPDGPVIIESNPEKYFVMVGKKGILLMIDNFSRDDAGDYWCSIRDLNVNLQQWSTIAQQELTLNYEEPASIIHFTDWEYNATKGDEFKLYCNATGVPKPKVWWEKRDNNEFKNEGPLLHLPSVTADDIGTYYCIADNNLRRPARREIRIRHVFYAPEMTCANTTFVSGQGWNVYATMSCVVRAYPVESVEWWKNTETVRERIIEKDPKYQMFHATRYDDSPQGWYHLDGLHVMVTEPGDAGKYIAVTSNRIGTQETEFTLIVV